MSRVLLVLAAAAVAVLAVRTARARHTTETYALLATEPPLDLTDLDDAPSNGAVYGGLPECCMRRWGGGASA